jgi:hypothetical protein
MGGIRSVLAFAILIVAASTGTALAQRTLEHAKPALPKKGEKLPPMAFFIAKGEPNACGAGCSEWIAADGSIDRKAGERLQDLIGKTGKRALPVYFHSAGGSVGGAVQIGRVMLRNDMRAGVGRTIPQGCNPAQERDAACDAIKRSGRALTAELRTVRTLCVSSCVYALVGANRREVAAGARLGVHAMVLGEFDKDGAVIGRKKSAPTPESAERLKLAYKGLETYLLLMGIDRRLVEAAAAIPPERLRYLSRDEIARFGIDARDFHESRWTVDEGPPGPLVVVKFVTQARGDPKQFRTTKIELACDRPREIRVTFSRELAATDKVASIAVSARGGDFVLPPRRGKPIRGYNDIEMEDRLARVPLAFFEEAAAGEAIELTEAPDISALDKPPRRIKLSTAGLKGAIEVLGKRCR